MGCGASKLEMDHKPHAGRIQPVLCGRFHEIRATRNSNTQDCAPIQRKITEAFGNVEARRLAMEPELQCRNGDDDNNNNNTENINEDEKHSQEEKNAIDERRLMLSHGSPSFRVYCKESADHILDLVKQADLDDNFVEGHRVSASQESVCSNQVALAKKEAPKKGRRMSMTKFRKMMARDANASFSFSTASENSPLLHKAVTA